MKKYYTAKYDRVFKTIFCNEDDTYLMREFLTRILERKVEEVQFLRNEIGIENVEEQVKTVDVFALVDGVYLHIEMNTGRGEEFMERFEKKINQLNEDETFQSWMSREEDMRIVANTEKAMAYEEGEKQGIQQGSISKMEEIGKNLKAMGLSMTNIKKATGLTEDQIKKL